MLPVGPEPFAIRDVVSDAARSFWRALGAHLRWTVGVVVLAIAGGLVLLLGSAILLEGRSPGAAEVGMTLAIAGVVLAAGLAISALHQGTTLAFTRAERSGGDADVGTALGEAMERWPALTIGLLARLAADSPVLLVATLAPPMFAAATGAAEDAFTDLLMGVAMLVGYAVSLVWMIVVRAFLGLSGPCAVHERAGPIEALVRSVRLLEGHRMKLVGVRLLWAMMAALACVAGYVPTVIWAVLVSTGDRSPIITMLFLPAVLSFYFVVLLVLSFDTVLEDAFYARATRPRSAAAVAEVFA